MSHYFYFKYILKRSILNVSNSNQDHMIYLFFRKTGEMFNLALDQIVLGLPPTDGESDIIVRTGRYLFSILQIYLSI